MVQTEVSADESAEKSGWQPEMVGDLAIAIRRLETELPGWWWRVGSCHVSSDATIGPDSSGPDAHLLYLDDTRVFDEGFDCDLRQPSTCAEALNGAIDEALEVRSAFMRRFGDRSDEPKSSDSE